MESTLAESARAFAVWAQGSPWRHPGLALLATAGLVAAALLPRLARFHGLLMLLTLVLLRLPTLALPELNPDESEDIANARTLLADPRFGLSAEGHTHGPLAVLSNLLPRLVGLPADYASVRLLGVLMLASAGLTLKRILERILDPETARIALTPFVVAMAWLSNWDYLAYNGEHPLGWLLLLGILATLEASRRRGPLALAAAALAGLALGLMPLVKLQGAPLALAASLWSMALLARRPGAWRERLLQVLAVSGAAIAPLLAFAGYAVASGLLRHFWVSYVLAGREQIFWQPPAAFVAWLLERSRDEAATPFLLATLAALALAAAVLRARGHLEKAATVLASALLSLLALFAVYRPGANYDHYLVLLAFPLGLLNGVLFGAVRASLPRPASKRWLSLAFVFFGALLPLPWALGRSAVVLAGAAAPEEASPVASEISRYARPGEPIVVWGWQPKYYVETATIQGTRYAHSARAMEGFAPRHDYFLSLFLEDFDRTRPVVFVDSGHKYEPREEFGPDRFPALAARLAAGYRQVAQIEGVRILVALDRLRTTSQ